MKTIINKTIKSGKYLYACFVDFKKAFDTVWRKGLMCKLKNIGIKGKVFEVIKSMYENSVASITMNGKVSESFKTLVGVQQGDILSPLLFNIFINDLPGEIESVTNENELKLSNTSISSLLFADDLSILSLSKEDLQNKLDTLQSYCTKWGLKVNLQKTKIMIFNKSGATIKKHKFRLLDTDIESVASYTYLGFIFIPSGKMHFGVQNLVNKAKKAWFAIQKYLHRSKEKSIHTYTKLIDSLIKPILLYSCEAWGDTTLKKPFESKTEKLHLSMCKQVLGIHKRAFNVGTLAELGRFPLYVDIETQMFKYLQRFIYADKERLLYKAFQEESMLDLAYETGWVTFMKGKLNNLGLTCFWKDIMMACKSDDLKKKYKNKSKVFKIRVRDTFLQSNIFAQTSNMNPILLKILFH